MKKGWEALNKSIKCLFDNVEQNMKNVRGKGVGQTTILKFLGETYKQWEIESALNTLDLDKSKVIDRKVVETLPLSKGDRFKKAVVESNIPRNKQAELAIELKANKVPTKDIEEEVREYGKKLKIKPKPIEPKPLPMLDDYVKETIKVMVDVQKRLTRIQGKMDSIQNSLTKDSFTVRGNSLRKTLNDIFPVKE